MDQRGALHALQSRPLKLTSPPAAPPAGPSEPALHPVLLQGGNTASPGTASGKVVLLRGSLPGDLAEDAILVVRAASPEHAALIGKVRGIVADTGSAVSHLACVSREFGVPAIFDAGTATALLRQGEEVTMVADTATVYRGVVPELVAVERPVRKHVFESPLHQRLRAVLDHVAPLNLTDPAQASFTIAGCRTVHDVIRFAHEQAMREMFGLSQRGSGGRGSVKLRAQVPLSLYLIDLGGGLAQGAKPVTYVPKFAYVANYGSGNVSVYTIDASTGALTSVGSPAAAGTGAFSVTVDPSGKFAYAANYSSGNVSAYIINASTGALTTVGSPVAAGTAPYSVTVAGSIQ